ncbi:2-keto-4-pentenoate hydratase [Alteromonas sp. a30]|uniref:2-keto-4-pentenoate hydratase n=1 Tax=Alteromonas sp. a30 TaxID=2730917 RepID=UPI00227E6E3B|nr:hypothetical protein [Alteromonas sp. a30]MCY7295551.1 hypothetical protein [Alteromonas sp. a30]
MNVEDAERLVSTYPHHPVIDLPKTKNLEEAYCSQQMYVEALAKKLGSEQGKIVGYKVSFTGKAGQEKFGIPHPAYGVLMQGMIENGQSDIKFDFGYRPMIEPDLMVRVKSENIMQATTLLDVAEGLESLHAFIEMPTIQFPLGKLFTSNDLISLNVGATKMILGEGVKIEATPEFVEKLALAQTEFVDDSGNVIQAAPLKNLMQHPFNAVLWLISELKRHNKALKAGDYISLGAVGRLFPVVNETKTYIYRIQGVSEKPMTSSVKIISV